METKFKILCPVDFSDSSENAVKVAAHMASKSGASISLLHVFKRPVFASDIPIDLLTMEVAENRDCILSNLVVLLSLVKSIDPLVACDYQMEEGLPEHEIVKTAQENRYDLVVMGTKGPSAFEMFVFGSKTVDVLNKLSCPLLIIPEKYSYKSPERIVYASDFMEKDIEAIKWMVEFAKSFDPEIIVLNVAPKDKQDYHFYRMFKAQVKRSVSYPKIMVHQTSGDNIRESLEMYDKANSADWVAMMTRKRDGLNNLFRKSLSVDLAVHSQIPVLIFHFPETYKDLYGDWILKRRLPLDKIKKPEYKRLSSY